MVRPMDEDGGTLKPSDTGTLVSPLDSGTIGTLESDLATMVINSDSQADDDLDEEDSTMKSKKFFIY